MTISIKQFEHFVIESKERNSQPKRCSVMRRKLVS